MIAQMVLTFVVSKRENDLSMANQVKKRLLLKQTWKVHLFDYPVKEIVAQLVEQKIFSF